MKKKYIVMLGGVLLLAGAGLGLLFGSIDMNQISRMLEDIPGFSAGRAAGACGRISVWLRWRDIALPGGISAWDSPCIPSGSAVWETAGNRLF